MKTILIATDFSEASRNASLYGVELAKVYNAGIILFSSYEVPIAPPEAMLVISPAEMRQTTEEHLKQEVKFLNPSGDLLIETICKEANAANAIFETANDKKVDMIIVGMKGSFKTARRFFGSVSTALTRKTNLPLLIIPENAKFTIPKTIVLASDIESDTETDIHLLYFLRLMAEKFESTIYAVRVDTGKMNELFSRSGKLNCLLPNLDVKYKYPEDNNVVNGLNEFVKEHNADLLVMIPHKHDLPERIFIKSETKDMLFHTTIPLLVLPDKPYELQHKKTDRSKKKQLLYSGTRIKNH